MNKRFREYKIQDAQYTFPYHYIPEFDGYNFHIAKVRVIGYEYMSYISHIVDKLGIFDDVLDVGAGDGRMIYEIKNRYPDKLVRGIDISEKAIAFAKAFTTPEEVILGDIKDPEVFSGHTFSAATCIEVLEHIPPDDLAEFVTGIARHLKPGGKLFITVPNDNIPTSPKHYQHFNPEKLIKVLSGKFLVEELYFINRMHWMVSLMRSLFVNQYYILNHRRTLNYLFRMYRRRYFRGDAHNTRRIFVECKRKADG